MTARLRAQDLIDHALSQADALGRELLNAIQDELDARPQHFALRETWRRTRGGFSSGFAAQLNGLLHEARLGGDPLHRPAGSLDSLSLVDEQQALQDVALAHVVQAAEDLSKPELHQLGNFFAALRGTARARERDNPLRPALYAKALHLALGEAGLSPRSHHDLMRVAAPALAAALRRQYVEACAELRAADLSDMVASHGTSHYLDPFAQQRQAARGFSGQGTLDGLARRVEAANSRPQALHDVTPTAARPAPFVKATGPDMLSRLYDQILADPRLLPPLKGLLARLQVAVVRLARSDATLLRRQDHPTWALLNRVAAHGMGFERVDDERLQGFLRFMDGELKLLIDAPVPTALLFQQVLSRVETEIDDRVRERGAANAEAVAALERGEMRANWQRMVAEQIEHQTHDAPLVPRVQRFLQTAWVEVIVEAMIRHGRESREAQAAIETVDALLDSLHTLRDRAAAEGLRMRLPGLIERLQAGCDSIQLSLAKRDGALSDLMAQHARVLRGLPALEPAPKPAAPAAPPSAESIVRRLVEERDSQAPSLWLSTDVDRGGLPTVPVTLYSEQGSPQAREALQAWADSLQIGQWFHLFIQGDWRTVQIAWISDTRQTLLFVGREPDERHSLTRGALEALLANGLMAALDDLSVVQRAVNTLMNDLDEGG